MYSNETVVSREMKVAYEIGGDCIYFFELIVCLTPPPTSQKFVRTKIGRSKSELSQNRQRSVSRSRVSALNIVAHNVDVVCWHICSHFEQLVFFAS